MPKRSNLFQRLVLEVQNLGSGWQVQESRELPDSVTGETREVDIVAEASVGGYQLLIGIEVRDHRRKADVAWVEGMAKKHEHLPTNKVVLWSASGFSAAAIRKAAAIKLTTVVPTEGLEAPWANIARALVGGLVKFVRPEFTLTVDYVDRNGIKQRFQGTAATTISDAASGAAVPLGIILDFMSNNPDVRTVLLDHAPTGSGSFHAVYVPPVPAMVATPSGSVAPLYRILVGITTVTEIAPLKTRALRHDQVVTTIAEAGLTDGTLKLVVCEPASGSASVKATHSRRRCGLNLKARAVPRPAG